MTSQDELAHRLALLAEVVEERDLVEVAELRRRLDFGVFRVLVTGTQKRGKSTLINALLGRPVLRPGSCR